MRNSGDTPDSDAIRRRRGFAVTVGIAAAFILAGCATGRPHGARETSPPQTFADVPVTALRAHPEDYVGTVFDERFVFSRVWWSHDRARPGLPSLDLPTHFTARIAAAPLYIARIEFPPEADATFENMRDGTELRLRVRFVGIHPASRSPIFAYEAELPAVAPGSDLDYLRR